MWLVELRMAMALVIPPEVTVPLDEQNVNFFVSCFWTRAC